MAKESNVKPVGAESMHVKRVPNGYLVQIAGRAIPGPFGSEQREPLHFVFTDFLKLTQFMIACFRAHDDRQADGPTQ